MSKKVSPEAMNIALLKEIQSAIGNLRENQESKGEIYPEKNVTITDKVKEINPGIGKWRSVSVYNSGSSDCDVQINYEADLLTLPVSLLSKVSKEFSFTTEVISKLYAKCATGETTTLEVEFKR